MKTTLIVGKVKVDLGYSIIQNIISSLEDIKENKEIFDTFAAHPSHEIRSEVAYKEHISADTIQSLAKDSSIDVVRRIISNNSAYAVLDLKTIQSIIARDIVCASDIASSVDRWNPEQDQNYEVKDLVEILIKHSDPIVRYNLARNSDVPKNYLKKLAKDSDSSVAQAAEDSLRY